MVDQRPSWDDPQRNPMAIVFVPKTGGAGTPSIHGKTSWLTNGGDPVTHRRVGRDKQINIYIYHLYIYIDKHIHVQHIHLHLHIHIGSPIRGLSHQLLEQEPSRVHGFSHQPLAIPFCTVAARNVPLLYPRHFLRYTQRLPWTPWIMATGWWWTRRDITVLVQDFQWSFTFCCY